MSAPSFSPRSKRRADQIRTARACGRTYRDVAYRRQYAIGIMCLDEQDQRLLFRRLRPIVSGRPVKVLSI